MTEPYPQEFSNDLPLLRKADDKLNRAPFAERVARVLRGLPRGTGLVVGIHGPWGDGKTTVLNMLRGDLKSDERTVVRDFNPWRLTDEESMLRGFFSMLAEAFGESLSTRLERTKAGTGKLVKGVRWVTRPAGWVWRPAESVDNILAKFEKVAMSGDTVGLDDLRTRIATLLKDANKRIVDLVDDIDRLDKHETHTLFRLIKACADFPNVCYVLAFDDVAVSASLGERYGAGNEASGRAFLEKIIQVPLKLPVAMKEDLRSLCFQQIDQTISAAGLELSKKDVADFVWGFDRGFSLRLDTPRAAKRYGNGLMFALPMLKGEVNIVDLLLIEAVRAFYPTVYDVIRANHAEFSGFDSEHRSRGHDGLRAVALLRQLVEAHPAAEQEAIKSLLKDLFPKLGNAYGYGNIVYDSESCLHWAMTKRICSPDYCSRYFSYSVPISDVSDSEMGALYGKAIKEPAAAIWKDMAAYFTGGKAKRVIERMRQREESTPPEAVASLCGAISANVKHIPNQPSLFVTAEPVSQAGILISHLIKRLNAGEARLALTKKVIESADPLWFGAEVLRWLYVTDDADKADRNTLTMEEREEAGKLLVERIKAQANSSQPLFSVDVPQEQELLFEWQRVEGREPVQAHLSAVFSSNYENIAIFLQAFAGLSWSLGDVSPHVADLRINNLENIRLIYNLDSLAGLIRSHLIGDFANPQYYSDADRPVSQRLAEQFTYVYNKWKDGGETRDSSVDAVSIQSKVLSADAESGNRLDLAVEHPNTEDGN